ncbi:MAG TPA: SRPBCC family protein [Solirubrobacteraceae bacterium]|nr:SRPBCC family protein [Solirubrobacteraceae bacterium]
MTKPSNLAQWRTSKTSVEQVVEFTEFDRPRHFHVHIVEGPYPIDGIWAFTPEGSGTSVTFVAEGELSGLLRLGEPLFKRGMAREFRGYHRNVHRNVGSA